jgi:molybdopterin converting factor small subunit
MLVEVRLFATFTEGRFTDKQMDLDEGASPADILRLLKIPEKQVAMLLINGRSEAIETKLNTNDVVALFPPVGGG